MKLHNSSSHVNSALVCLTFSVFHFAFAFAYDDVQLVYRGRLRSNSYMPMAGTVDMSFRLYAEKSDATPSWSKDVQAVKINGEGLFQVSLSGDGLADAINAGRVGWIGVSVDGGAEQYPRQAVLASPRADKAAYADALLSSPSVGTANVERVSARSMTVDVLSVTGATTMPPGSSPVSMSVAHNAAWMTLPVKGEVRFFSRGNPRDLGEKTFSNGCSFGEASENCVALFTADCSMPGLSRYYNKDADISLGSDVGLSNGTSVRCLVYPIGAE